MIHHRLGACETVDTVTSLTAHQIEGLDANAFALWTLLTALAAQDVIAVFDRAHASPFGILTAGQWEMIVFGSTLETARTSTLETAEPSMRVLLGYYITVPVWTAPPTSVITVLRHEHLTDINLVSEHNLQQLGRDLASTLDAILLQ